MQTLKSLDEIEITDDVLLRYNALRTQLKNRPYNVGLEELQEVQERPGSELLLFLYIDEEIAGVAQVSYICSPESYAGYINNVVIDTQYRGKGLGSTLMEELQNRAIARWPRLKKFVLTSAPYLNTQGFYQRLGYRPRTKESGDETIFYVKDVVGLVS
jgi:ribosomal protein S18 acetylase RimI-like enzyme